MNELNLWVIGSVSAMIFTFAILFDAILSYRWAQREEDPELIREGWRCVRNQLIAGITQTLMVSIGVIAYLQFHTNWVVWGLVAIPWTINLRVFFDFLDRKRLFHRKVQQKETEGEQLRYKAEIDRNSDDD